MNSTSAQSSAALPVLDPRTLGRPVHLLGKFGAMIRQDLAERLRTGLNRRYHAHFQLDEVQVSRLDDLAPAQRWSLFDTPSGQLGFALDRPLLLTILDYRYGSGAGSAKTGAHPETATEERLATMLARQFVGVLAERIAALPGVEADAGELRECRRGTPSPGAWAVRAALAEPARGVEGALWLALDDGWMDRVFRGLAAARPASQRAVAPLGSALQLDLRARLIEFDIPLGMLLDTRVGDVIPVDLGRSDVLVNDSLLFRADVAEHKGKLCLTAFQDTE